MNPDLLSMNGILSFASTSEIRECLVVDKKIDQAISIRELPPLRDILKEIGPLPEEALFLGLAEDGLPVLLNIWDPEPGPILVAGDSKAGKTDFLKTIARYIITTRQSCDIQYGVLTDFPDEWNGYVEYPHCIGVFSTAQKSTNDYIQALTIWIEKNKISQQSVLLLIDGLEDFVNLNDKLSQGLKKILLYGSGAKVWPVATVNLENFQRAKTWLNYFRTRIFGYTKHTCIINDNGCYNTGFEDLSKGVEFSLKEGSEWLKFQIPRS